jgi:hypothetical protein
VAKSNEDGMMIMGMSGSCSACKGWEREDEKAIIDMK